MPDFNSAFRSLSTQPINFNKGLFCRNIRVLVRRSLKLTGAQMIDGWWALFHLTPELIEEAIEKTLNKEVLKD